jgi:hypothetical protein
MGRGCEHRPVLLGLVAISISMAMGVLVIISVLVLAFRLSDSRAESARADAMAGDA